MKIKWIDDQREVPGIGILNTDDIVNLPADMAKNFIKQGQAESVGKKNKKTKDEI